MRYSHPVRSGSRGAITLLVAVVLALSLTHASCGQPAEDPAAMPLEALELNLKPLRQAELVEEVERWLGLLEEKVAELSAVEVQTMTAEGEAQQALIEQAATLRDERTALLDRASVVVDALEEKGGDVEEYEKYLAAVSGVTVDVTDAGAAWATVRAWLQSKEGGIRWARNIASFIVVLIAAWILGRILGGIVRRAVTRVKKASELLRVFLVNATRKVTYVVGIVIALSMLGVDIGPLLAVIGVAGFVIGFALQGTLSNFASGIMILMYRPFDVGDVVDVAGVSGKVESMTLVSTTIATFDNRQIVVPNNSIWGSVITNITGKPTRRVDMVFGISYSDDIEKARGILQEIVSAHEKVLADPAPVIKMHELADSSVNFIVRPWSSTGDYWDVYWDVTRAVKERFDAAGVSIPFPQRDVHMHQAD